MQTFDTALYKLYKEGQISMDEALKNADSKNNLRLRITLEENPSSLSKEQIAKLSEPESTSQKPEKPEPKPAPKLTELSLEPISNPDEEETRVQFKPR
jgi:twitching motility protein PilU